MSRTFLRCLAPAVVVLLVTACGGTTDPGGNGNGGDPTLPSVSSVSPADGATDVDPGATVTVTFSEPVEAASVTPAAFTVGSATGSIDVNGATATFTPDAAFGSGASMSVQVSGVRDLEGNAMASSFSSSFTVRSAPTEADAGEDVDVSFGQSVTLDPSASTGDGLSFSWVQTAGPSVGTLSGDSPSFAAPSEVTRLEFELTASGNGQTSADRIVLFVMEDRDHAFFVAPGGNDANAGSRAAPFATLQAALDSADTDGNGGDVYLAGGTYQETLTLRSRVSIYGGFDPATWERDLTAFRPVIEGGSIAVSGTETNNLTIEGVEIVVADAPDSGQSSIGLLLDNSTGVVIRFNRILAGLGYVGKNGGDGSNGRLAGNGGNGTVWGNCPPSRTGGGGGSSPVGRTGGGGGTGGAAGGFPGGGGAGSGGGGGGSGGSTGNTGNPGGDGDPAGDGSAGVAGALGTLDGSGFTAAIADGGNAGAHGWGGGGGGGGGGGLIFACGGGGGGGGGGGEGATGGGGGQGGGASIGIALAGTSQADIENNEIETAGGADGGTGGDGGDGGAGGSRGNGGGCSSGIGCGGRGGNGTRGGHGGGGGGGMGGPSYGILEGVDAASFASDNVFILGPAGAGGAGGASSANAGNAGAAGEQAESKKLT